MASSGSGDGDEVQQLRRLMEEQEKKLAALQRTMAAREANKSTPPAQSAFDSEGRRLTPKRPKGVSWALETPTGPAQKPAQKNPKDRYYSGTRYGGKLMLSRWRMPGGLFDEGG